MLLKRIVITHFAVASLCFAQPINISGTVTDSGGVGIDGAIVKLENADITTTTSAVGTFVLTGSAIMQPAGSESSIGSSPVRFRNGHLEMFLAKAMAVSVCAYQPGGEIGLEQ
jgi:hypothetical protein